MDAFISLGQITQVVCNNTFKIHNSVKILRNKTKISTLVIYFYLKNRFSRGWSVKKNPNLDFFEVGPIK